MKFSSQTARMPPCQEGGILVIHCVTGRTLLQSLSFCVSEGGSGFFHHFGPTLNGTQ